MPRRFGIVFAFGFLALGALALADDEILLKGKAVKLKGVIASESVKGIVLKSGDKHNADDIDDIVYDLGPAVPVLASISYGNAFKSERDWLAATDPKKRATAYADSLDKYEKALSQVNEKKARAHLEFKLGYLRGKKALEDGVDPKNAATTNAITRLRDFVKQNPNSWQVTRALLLLAKLQVDAKDYIGADQSFAEILKLDVPEDVKNDAKLQSALINVQEGKHAQAEAKLADLIKTLPKGSKAYSRVLVAQAEGLLAGGKADSAVELLKKAIKESDDKALRAVAHNALGSHYYKQEQLKEARWEFLFVDVVYNQDKTEHAKALYHLSKIFDRLADPDKAAQCRATLLDPAYSGTDYQRKLQQETKK